MSAQDISRFLFQPRKRYSGVRMQQGRVILDSDWNESERLDDEDARRTLLDVLCSKGTSNDGFRVGEVETADDPRIDADTYDFELAAGSFYLGGLRFESDPAERFLTQSDWLRSDGGGDGLPAAPTLEELESGDGSFGERHDLVYLRGWEQCVTAPEDGEIRERALGGPDTSTRVRRMRRAEVLVDAGDSCPAAFAELRDRLTEPPDGDDERHLFDEASCELRSKARLTVTFGEGDPDDPCKPKAQQGFLGAENQTIRVQLTAPDRFIWGYDNASPFYRVQVLEEGGELVQVKFLTLPRDQASQPLAGQAVEVLPWSAFLPNQEKVAELRGHLATVATSYDPEEQTLTLSQPVPEEWLQWQADHPEYHRERDPEERRQYFYLRLWTGGSGDGDAPDHELTPGEPVELAGTGLELTWSDHGLPGDYWILAARPNTPEEVVPWELLSGAPPAGPRFFFAPLALVRWSVVPDETGNLTVRADVHDCRARFRPLCDLRGCCTFHVGDGFSSHGDFDSIEEALDHLPESGGEICLLPGQHRANAVLEGRVDVTVKGCGKDTRVVPRAGRQDEPIFRVADSRCVTLEVMDLVAPGGTAVLAESTAEGLLRELAVRRNRIVACDHAVRVEGGVEITVQGNKIRMLDKEGAGEGIFVIAEDVLIERNDVGVVPAETPPPDFPEGSPDPTDPCEDPDVVVADLTVVTLWVDWIFGVLVAEPPEAPYLALGGIRVGAGSERVRLLENEILGGAGNGVTLGGGGAVPAPEEPVDPQEPPPVIDHREDFLPGYVEAAAGARARDVGLLFTRTSDGLTVTAVTDLNGAFSLETPPGQYAVAVTTPGLRIVDIESMLGPNDDATFWRIRVEPAAVRPRPRLAFLYEIEIEANDISDMGLSGIGVPPPAPALATDPTTGLQTPGLATFGNVVVDLDVHRNRIHGCLRNPFDDVLQDVARVIGLGGVSLGIAVDVTISENRITGNGRRHVDPVCGIFARLGQWVTIRDNVVLDNGPLSGAGPVDPTTGGFILSPGERGGIVVLAAQFQNPAVTDSAPFAGPATTSVGFDRVALHDVDRPAALIHGNVVSQPAGYSLRLWAAGPVSVCKNHLATQLLGPGVLRAVEVVNVAGAFSRPPGHVLFEGNQTRHGTSPFNQLQFLQTAGELIFTGNHSRADGSGATNTWLTADRALVAGHNRFEEPAANASLRAHSNRVNTTDHNQGDHCIFVTGPAGRVVNSANQVLNPGACSPQVVVWTELAARSRERALLRLRD